MNYSNAELNQLAWAIDSDGVNRHEEAAAAVAAQARAAGLVTPLVDVLADTSVPAPVRERAFGKVVNAIVHASATSPEWALAN
ncbi:MAG: hypothetical protein V9G12_22505 [Microthrixaceae bacterium]|jgi:hypothetical protein